MILLLDEYDAAMNEAFQRQFYYEAADFLGKLYSKALKGNGKLRKACICGIVKAHSAGIMSGLNNLVTHSVLNDRHCMDFGFDADECRQLMQLSERFTGDDLDMSNLSKWYNGYHFGDAGGQNVFNPWSVAMCCDTGKFKTYWTDTAIIDGLQDVLARGSSHSWVDFMQLVFIQSKQV